MWNISFLPLFHKVDINEKGPYKPVCVKVSGVLKGVKCVKMRAYLSIVSNADFLGLFIAYTSQFTTALHGTAGATDLQS